MWRTLPLLLLLACGGGTSDRFNIYVYEARIAEGDDPAWASFGFDDRQWDLRLLAELPKDSGIYWLRAPVALPEREARIPLTVAFSALCSFEVYWDGELVGGSGTVGQSLSTEIPGAIDEVVYLPTDAVAAGEHLLAIRASNYHYDGKPEFPFYRLRIGEAPTTDEVSLNLVLPLFFLGTFVLIGLWYLAMYFWVQRDASVLLFSTLCFSVAGLLLAESWRPLFGYPWHLHLLRLRIVWSMTLAACLLLPAFMLLRFSIRPAWPWVTVNLLLLLIAQVRDGYDGAQAAMYQLSLGLSMVIAGVALWRRLRGSALALVGLAACQVIIFVDAYAFIDRTIFIGFAILIGVLLILLGQQMRRQDLERQRARTTSARLEAELLKRQIQPHFMMNTLTHASEWLERDPKQGVAIIEDLADEMRRLGEASRAARIPIGEELAMCRSHLSLMGRRLNRSLELDVEGEDPTEEVPPALFHTLIENGLSHNQLPAGDVRFGLRIRRDNGVRVFEFTAPGVARDQQGPDGTGLRYVKSRLEESYPGRWTFQAGPCSEGWRSVIVVTKGKG